MRAITITKHGGPEVLKVVESADPVAGPGQIRVRVKACGLNFAELMARVGLYPDAPKPPCVVGYEAAGLVDQVGEGVEAFAVGDRVLLATKFGAHADTVVTAENQVYAMPEGMSFEEGAALPVNYLTAWHMLFPIAGLRPGNSVLVHMAAGGVGIATLQLCQTVENVTTYGTASPGKHEFIREQGCDHPIDYRSKDYAQEVRQLTDGRGVDIILDALGGDDWKKGYELLAPAGKLVAFGFANMASGTKRNLFTVIKQFLSVPKWSPMNLMDTNRLVAGVNMGHLWGEVEMLRVEMEALLALYRAGSIKPHVDTTFSFEAAGDAHQYIHDRKNVGKVVLVP